MGLQDLLAVVLGVKTAEWLEERRGRPRVTPASRRVGQEFERVYSLIEDVICDECPPVIDDPAGLWRWAVSAQPRLRGYRREIAAMPALNPLVEEVKWRIDEVLEDYDRATDAVINQRPGGREMVIDARWEWRDVQNRSMEYAGIARQLGSR